MQIQGEKIILADFIAYQQGSVVSKEIISQKANSNLIFF